jgi:hypothetical protein
MIFCDEPWCNEPGREAHRGTQMSKDYNKTVHALTVRYAMLNWLQANHDTVWNDIVTEHFRNNADTIVKMVNKWAEDSPVSRPTGGYGVGVASLSDLALQLNDALSKFRQQQPAEGSVNVDAITQMQSWQTQSLAQVVE